MPAYNPNAQYDVKIWDEEFRKTPARTLMARIYQPQGPGPFPTLLDLHGGAWNEKDRTAEPRMDEALARSGILVVAVDLRLAPDTPYPGSIQDGNYAVRWLKHKAPQWKGDPTGIGIFGSSTGGYVAELVAMKPRDPRYSALPLAEAPNVDATVAYVIGRSPISDPVARYQNAENKKRDGMMQKTKNYFAPWETIYEGNPQQILDRGEKVSLPPILIMQGALDDNVIPPIQRKFVESYRKAGGECHLEVFDGCDHMWVHDPGPQTDRAQEMAKAFIAKHLRALQQAA